YPSRLVDGSLVDSRAMGARRPAVSGRQLSIVQFSHGEQEGRMGSIPTNGGASASGFTGLVAGGRSPMSRRAGPGPNDSTGSARAAPRHGARLLAEGIRGRTTRSLRLV